LSSPKVQVRLAYRTPVLEVMLSERVQRTPPRRWNSSDDAKRNFSEDPSWFADGKAIVLPRRKLAEPLPLLLVTRAPSGKPGQPWGEGSVEAAARTAAFL